MSNYAKDLPANLGHTEIFRAIYDKIGSDTPSSVKVVEKLDDISQQLGNVNDNLSNVNITLDVHTQALENISKSIQNASLNANVSVNNKIIIDTSNLPGKDDMQKIVNSIDSVANSTADGFNKTTLGINSLEETNKQGFNKVTENVGKLADVNKHGFEDVTRAIQQSKTFQPEPPSTQYPPFPPCPSHPHPKPQPHPHHYCYHPPYPYNNWDDWLYYTYGAAENYYEIVANFWYHYTNSHNYEDESLYAYMDPK